MLFVLTSEERKCRAMQIALVFALVAVVVLVLMVLYLVAQLNQSNREVKRAIELIEGFMAEEKQEQSKPVTPTRHKTMWG